MLWDFSLHDPVTGKIIQGSHHLRGGTFAVGGSPYLKLNVTYNYGQLFNKAMPCLAHVGGACDIATVFYGVPASETIPLLIEGITNLQNNTSDNYWDATEGNAREALIGLLILANLAPHGIWRVV